MASWRLCQWPLLLLTLLTLVWYGWQEIKAQGADWMPVRYVRVEGAFQYIAKDSVKTVLDRQLRNGFYNADLQHIQAEVMALPWAERVDVRRNWPDAITVKIMEQQPVARWRNDRLINASGELFQPENLDPFAQLPLIDGPEGRASYLLEVMIGLQLAFKDKSLLLKEFVVNERRAWTVRLDSGQEIKLGRNDPLQKLQRLLKTVDLLGNELMASIVTVDMRYPNGYAVTWREGTERNIREHLIKRKQRRA